MQVCRLIHTANLLQAEQQFINRDAVAAVLGHVDVGCPPQQAVVLDIRRHDERALYGSIPGMNQGCMVHIQLPEVTRCTSGPLAMCCRTKTTKICRS